MRILIYILLFTAGAVLFFNKPGYSQSIIAGAGKGYEAMEIYNYFEARRIFSKSLKNKPVVSSYGLADIFQRGDNPFYDLDSAYTLTEFALQNIPNSSRSERKLMLLYKIDSVSVGTMKDQVAFKAFQYARDTADLNILNGYINHYYRSPFVVPATRIRDSVAFSEVIALGTSNDFKDYMDEYPDSQLRQEALERMHLAQFNESVIDNDLESYRSFIQRFPLNPYINDAYATIYELEVPDKSDIQKLKTFIDSNPQNPYINDAWMRIYDNYFSVNYGDDAIQGFKKKYPQYPNQKELDIEYLLATTDFLPFNKRGSWGFTNPSGEEMIEPKYSSVQLFSEGLALFELNDKVGFVTKRGIEVVPAVYDDAEDFNNGLTVVFKDGKSGVINRSGKLVVPIIYDEISDYENGLAAASKDGRFGFIDAKGIVKIPFRFIEVGGFSNGYAICEMEGGLGIIDTSGRSVVNFEYETLENFDNGIARFGIDRKVGMINDSGKVIVEPVYDEIGVVSDNLAVVVKNRKVGYVGSDGSIRIPTRYQYTTSTIAKGSFRNGYAIVKLNGRFGLIDTAGKVVLRIQYEDMMQVTDSIVPIKKRGKWALYNLVSRKLVTTYVYDAIKSINQDRFIGKYKGKWTVTKFDGSRTLNAEYDFIVALPRGLYLVEIEGVKKIYGFKGEKLIFENFNNVDVVYEKYLMFQVQENISWYNIEKSKFITIEK